MRGIDAPYVVCLSIARHSAYAVLANKSIFCQGRRIYLLRPPQDIVMTKEDRLRSCRYYKGEADSPFTDENKDALWEYEAFWVSAGDSQDTISEYRAYVKNDHHPSLPIGLKALLLNRLSRMCYGGALEASTHLNDLLDKYYK